MLIIPLGRKGSSGIPLLTIFLCVACIIVHVFASSVADRLALAFHPDKPDVLHMFTSVFTHADFWHITGNLFFFYCFARTIEAQISWVGYLFAFVLFVFATNFAYMVTAPAPIPTIGLSGVVWGFMGMYLFRYPGDYIECFVWFLVWARKIEVPAFLFILAFLAIDIIAFNRGSESPVNYVAHFSGFITGALFRIVFWKLFSVEEPVPARRAATGNRPATAKLSRR